MQSLIFASFLGSICLLYLRLVISPFSSPFLLYVRLKDCQWYKHPIWPGAEVGVYPRSFAEAQTSDWLPTLIWTKSPRARTRPSHLHHVLGSAESIPTVSMRTDSCSTHEGSYMPSLAEWPWIGLAFLFLWRALGRPPLWCWHHMLLNIIWTFTQFSADLKVWESFFLAFIWSVQSMQSRNLEDGFACGSRKVWSNISKCSHFQVTKSSNLQWPYMSLCSSYHSLSFACEGSRAIIHDKNIKCPGSLSK